MPMGLTALQMIHMYCTKIYDLSQWRTESFLLPIQLDNLYTMQFFLSFFSVSFHILHMRSDISGSEEG